MNLKINIGSDIGVDGVVINCYDSDMIDENGKYAGQSVEFKKYYDEIVDVDSVIKDIKEEYIQHINEGVEV